MFSVLLIIFGCLLVISICCFCREKYRYYTYASERKQIKRQLEIIKDTEYANFLLLESEKLKSKYSGSEADNSGYTHQDMNVSNEDESD